MSDDLIRGWRAASKASGITIAHLRRHADRGQLPFTKDEEGSCIFAKADLEKLRNLGPLVDEAEPLGKPRAGPAAPPEDHLDGELAGAVFADLDAGKTLTAIVAARKIAPASLRQLYSEWSALKEIDLSTPSVPLSLKRAQQQIANLAEQVRTLTAQSQAHDVALGGDPFAGLREGFQCEHCSATGFVVTLVRCGSCGHNSDIGWRPDDEGESESR